MVTIKNLSSGYGDLEVLKNVSLSIPPGKISVLMGPNGAGKSTLLKSIFNLANITSGTILLEDEDITGLPTWLLLNLGIAYVPQGRINFQTLTVRENILLGAYTIGSSEVIERNYTHVMRHFPALKKLESRTAYQLSGGEAQMLALARALMIQPKVCLLDEPSLGLSPKLVSHSFELIRSMKEEFQMTIVIVEHNLKSVMKIADWAFIMSQGQIIAEGPDDELINSGSMEKVYLGKME